MIIWSRWGILVPLVAAPGVAVLALLALLVLPGGSANPTYGVFMGLGLMLGGLTTYLFNRFVLEPHLDAPRQQFVLERLPHPNGSQTHRRVALVHPETGQPVWVRPRSTLFFVPFRIWPAIIVTLGALLTFLGFVAAVPS